LYRALFNGTSKFMFSCESRRRTPAGGIPATVEGRAGRTGTDSKRSMSILEASKEARVRPRLRPGRTLAWRGQRRSAGCQQRLASGLWDVGCSLL
jgi:hypothetical protein